MAYRILLVEYKGDTRELLVLKLRLDGHHVETAEGGREALELLAVCSYDAILSSLRMPGMNGEDLYRRVEHGSPHLAPRVVFMTAENQTSGFQTQYGGAPTPILTKPFTLGQLRQVIARVIVRDN